MSGEKLPATEDSQPPATLSTVENQTKCDKYQHDAGHWLDCATLVTNRINARKEIEWQLAIQHFGALAASAYAAAVFLTPFLKTAPPCYVGCGIFVLVLSFLISWRWNYLTQTAHATDGVLYRSYVDRANNIKSKAVLIADEFAKQLEAEAAGKITKPTGLIWGDEQRNWFCIHFGISAIVHIGVVLVMIGLMDDGSRTDAADEKKNKAKAEAKAVAEAATMIKGGSATKSGTPNPTAK
ncbi:MAG: hypothetical protein V4719_29235 [Planctomycetota bacterium]